MYMYLFLYTSMRSKRCFKNPQQNHFLCLCRCQISVILYTKSIFLEKIKLYNFDVMRSNFVSNFVFFNSLGILREWKDYRFGKIFPKLIFLSILTKATLKSYDFCHWVCLESALVLNDLFFDFFFVNTVKTNILVVHLPKARCKGIFIKKKIITVEYVNGTEYHLIQRMIK